MEAVIEEDGSRLLFDSPTMWEEYQRNKRLNLGSPMSRKEIYESPPIPLQWRSPPDPVYPTVEVSEEVDETFVSFLTQRRNNVYCILKL